MNYLEMIAMHRYICEHCGAYLDAGEKCDCRANMEQKKKVYREILSTEKNGQMFMEVNSNGAYTRV